MPEHQLSVLHHDDPGPLELPSTSMVEEQNRHDMVAYETAEAMSVMPMGFAVAATSAPEPNREEDAESAKTVTERDPNGLEDQTNYLPTKQVIIVFLGVGLSLGLAWLESTIVATALPSITADLHGGKQSSWVATAYLMSSLAFTPVYGRWSDIFGRKYMLLLALVVFFIFSLACALAKTMTQLIIFRALQGVGGGSIMTIAMIIPNDIVSLQQRSKYQGIIEVISVLSNGSGPIIGGALSQYASWRWAFWLNLPLCALAIAVTYWFLPLKKVGGDMKTKLKQVDYAGSALTIIAAVLIVLGIVWGGVTYPWTSVAVLAPLIIGVVTFIAFLVWEGKVARLPIIPLYTFKVKTSNGTFICTLFSGMTFGTILFYVPQMLQFIHRKSPMTASLLLIPFLGTIGPSVILSGYITTRTGHYKTQIVTGFALWTVAQGILTTVNGGSSMAKVAGALALAGVAAGMTFQTLLLAGMAAVPRHEQAVNAGVRSFVRAGGTTIALAIDASIVNNILRRALDPLGLSTEQITTLLDDPTSLNSGTEQLMLTQSQRDGALAGYAKGFKTVFYVSVAYCALATISAILLVGQHELERPDDKLQEEKMKEEKRRKREAREEKARRKLETPPSEQAASGGDRREQGQDEKHEGDEKEGELRSG